MNKLIELPLISASSAGDVCSAEPPAAILNKLLDGYEMHKTTQHYRDAVESAKECQAREQWLSHKPGWAQHNYSHGEKLSDMVKDGDVDFDDLDDSQQHMVHDFDNRGAGAETRTTS